MANKKKPTFVVRPQTAKIVLRPHRSKRQDLMTRRWKRVRLEIIERDGAICRFCGCDCSDDPTVDHLESVVCGGPKLDPANLVVACRSCNGHKGGHTGRQRALARMKINQLEALMDHCIAIIATGAGIARHDWNSRRAKSAYRRLTPAQREEFQKWMKTGRAHPPREFEALFDAQRFARLFAKEHVEHIMKLFNEKTEGKPQIHQSQS